MENIGNFISFLLVLVVPTTFVTECLIKYWGFLKQFITHIMILTLKIIV